MIRMCSWKGALVNATLPTAESRRPAGDSALIETVSTNRSRPATTSVRADLPRDDGIASFVLCADACLLTMPPWLVAYSTEKSQPTWKHSYDHSGQRKHGPHTRRCKSMDHGSSYRGRELGGTGRWVAVSGLTRAWPVQSLPSATTTRCANF